MKLGAILQAIGMLAKYGPLVLKYWQLGVKLVTLVETLRSNAPGEQKKEAVLEGIRRAAELTSFTLTPQIMDAISKGIDLVVSILNARGALRHQEAPKVEMTTMQVTQAAARVKEEIIRSDTRLDQLEALLIR
jgi:hypothetical protein